MIYKKLNEQQQGLLENYLITSFGDRLEDIEKKSLHRIIDNGYYTKGDKNWLQSLRVEYMDWIRELKKQSV